MKIIGPVLGLVFWALIWLPLHIIFGVCYGAIEAWEDLKTAMEK